MKVKSLLPLACIAAAAFNGSAMVPMKLKSATNMDYPVVEGSRTFNDDGSIKYYGDMLFDSEGAITLTMGSKGADGFHIDSEKLTQAASADHTVVAFDYKATIEVTDLVIFLQDNDPWVTFFRNGAVFTVAPNYQTCYVLIDRNVCDWGNEGVFDKDFIWISSNGAGAKTEGFQLTIKNLRLLTIEEAKAEATGEVTTPIADIFRMANADWAWDYDVDMQSTVLAKNGGNPVWFGGSFFAPLPATHTTYRFDYKYMGGPEFQGYGWLGIGGAPTNPAFGKITPIEGEDPYAAPWNTCSVDFKAGIEASNWAKTFPGSDTDFVWFQSHLAAKESTMWIKNARWVDPTKPEQSGLTNIIADKNTDTRIFNLQGIEVKGDLAPGIYIQGGKKYVVR